MILARSLSVAKQRAPRTQLTGLRRLRQEGSKSNWGTFASAAACLAIVGGVVGGVPSESVKCREREQSRGVVFFQQGNLGAGSFGTVRIGKYLESNENVAVKIVQENDKTKDVIESEIETLERIRRIGGHKNVVQYMTNMRQPRGSTATAPVPLADWLETSYASIVDLITSEATTRSSSSSPEEGEGEQERWLLFEHVQGQELYDAVIEQGKLELDEVSDITRQIATALKFLHEKAHVAHGDIKPENILLSAQGDVKLIDFGSALPLRDPETSRELNCADLNLNTIGTSAYCAPEVLDGASELTTGIDVWALGCVVYILVSGSHPFDLNGTRSDAEVMRAVLHEPVTFTDKVWTTAWGLQAREVVEGMLAKDPRDRATLDQVLAHPFLSTLATLS